MRDPSVHTDLILDLDFSKVVHFVYTLLDRGRMTHADEARFDFDHLHFCVEQLINFD